MQNFHYSSTDHTAPTRLSEASKRGRNLGTPKSHGSDDEQSMMKLVPVGEQKTITPKETLLSGNVMSRTAFSSEVPSSRNLIDLPTERSMLWTTGSSSELRVAEVRSGSTKPSADAALSKRDENIANQVFLQEPDTYRGILSITNLPRSTEVGRTSPTFGSKSTIHPKGLMKTGDKEHSLQNLSVKKSSAQTVKQNMRMKRQNSSPTLKSKQRSNLFTSTEGGFLSNLVANRPSAARGLVGVASAALAAARAGTFMSTYEEPEVHFGKSRSFDKRSSETSRIEPEHICPCCHRPTNYPYQYVPPPLRITNWDMASDRLIRKRRYSDSLLSSPAGCVSDQPVQVYMCATCDQHGVFTQPNYGTLCEHDWKYSSRPTSPFYRKTSLTEVSPAQIEPSDYQLLHSSWVALNTNRLSDFEVGPSRSTSTAMLDVISDSTANKLTGVYSTVTGRHDQAGSSHLCEDKIRKSSKEVKSHGYVRPKRQGLDSIGLDFMRLNGARPGLLQLRHVKEFKAAKELEQQQQKQAQSDKAKQKTTMGLRNTGPLTLLGHTIGAVQPNQQNPFHQLISGGVLGATVLAMAGKDKAAQKAEASSSEKNSNTVPKTTSSTAADPELTKQKAKDDMLNQINLGTVASRRSSKSSNLSTPRGRTSQGTSIYMQREPSVGQTSGRFNKFRKKLIRSVTTAPSETKDVISSPMISYSIPRLPGNLSAPGLTRHATEEYDECERGEVSRFHSSDTVLRKSLRSESTFSTQGQSVPTTINASSERVHQIREPSSGELMLQQTTSTDGSVYGTASEESASVRSRRYFTNTFSEQEPIVSTVHTQQRMMGIRAISTVSSACARKRRDNFRKGRSSAFTWVVNDTIGETSECPVEEETPLLPKIVPNESKSVELHEHVPDSLEPDATSRSVELVNMDRGSLRTRVVGTKPFGGVVSHAYVNDQCLKDGTELTKHPDIPVLKVEEISRDQESIEEITLSQRRRDAMNNQLQQRTIRNVGYRLGRRKRLFEKRCRISDFALIFALFGIVVMLVETELTFIGVYQKDSVYSYFTKSLITLSTAVLLALILAYHVYAIKIFSSDDSIEDWRMAVDQSRIIQLVTELLICIIHPFPGSSYIHLSIPQSYIGPEAEYYSFGHCDPISYRYFINKYVNLTVKSNRTQGDYFSFPPENNISSQLAHHNRLISIDLVLSVPMFFRLYLVFRTMLLHSKLFTDAGSRSIGAMNKVNFDMRFIFKTLMTMCPGKLLLGFILCLWIVYSWSLRACESFSSQERVTLLNSMWLVAVTFLSIGYGDIVPHTYCGRAIALATGVMGSGCTALIVAVFARKLELSKAEKHVIHFMMENQLNKKVKNYAANVLRETWLIYKYTKLVNRVDAAKVRTHQRKFLRAIHGLRRMKMDQRKVQDSANTLVDLAKTQSNIYETVTDLRMEQNCLSHRMEVMETTLMKLQDQMRALPGILRATVMQQHFAYQKLASGRSHEQPSPSGQQSAALEQK